MSSHTERLISELASSLKPVHRYQVRARYGFTAFAVGLICVGGAVGILGFREDLQDQIASAPFMLETFLFLFVSLLASFGALFLTAPSNKNKRMAWLPVLALGLILAMSALSFLISTGPFVYFGHGLSCVFKVLAVGLLPSTFLFFRARRGAVLNRPLVGVLILMSGTSFGLLGVQLTCFDSSPLHTLIWHLLPAIFFVSIGAWLGLRVIQKI